MSSKRYPEEFRAEAVKQIIDRGYSVQEVSQRLGVSTHSLYNWLKASGRWGDKAQGDEIDAIRQENLEIHRDYLKSQKGILVLAGAAQSDDGTEAIGSVFIVNVNSRTEAEAFSNGDPFTQAGVFKSVTIVRMRKGQWNPEAAEGA